jgi:Ricin-type beta-trefoil lectin domain-like
VAGGSTAPGARVVGWDCEGPSHPDQYWLIFTNTICTALGVQYYPIVNYKSGLVLGVAGNSTATGAHIVIYKYQGRCNNQFWTR